MKLSAISVGVVVRCDVRGRIFDAPVTGRPAAGYIAVDPPAGVTYRRIRAHQVRGVVAAPPIPQLQLEVMGDA